jgi:hypothetical protein
VFASARHAACGTGSINVSSVLSAFELLIRLEIALRLGRHQAQKGVVRVGDRDGQSGLLGLVRRQRGGRDDQDRRVPRARRDGALAVTPSRLALDLMLILMSGNPPIASRFAPFFRVSLSPKGFQNVRSRWKWRRVNHVAAPRFPQSQRLEYAGDVYVVVLKDVEQV